MNVKKLGQHIVDLIARKLYGKLTIHFENGNIVLVKIEETLK